MFGLHYSGRSRQEAATAAEQPPSIQLGVAQRTVYVTADHADARRVARHLADHGLPVERTLVVGRDLQSAPSPARLSTPGVVAGGAVFGIAVAVLAGGLLDRFDLVTPVLGPGWVAVNAAILGAVFGASLGLAGYGITRGWRSATAEARVVAARFEVMVDADAADRAVRMLGSAPGDSAGGGAEPVSAPASGSRPTGLHR